jgi:hypothetical protein
MEPSILVWQSGDGCAASTIDSRLLPGKLVDRDERRQIKDTQNHIEKVNPG